MRLAALCKPKRLVVTFGLTKRKGHIYCVNEYGWNMGERLI